MLLASTTKVSSSKCTCVLWTAPCASGGRGGDRQPLLRPPPLMSSSVLYPDDMPLCMQTASAHYPTTSPLPVK